MHLIFILLKLLFLSFLFLLFVFIVIQYQLYTFGLHIIINRVCSLVVSIYSIDYVIVETFLCQILFF